LVNGFVAVVRLMDRGPGGVIYPTPQAQQVGCCLASYPGRQVYLVLSPAPLFVLLHILVHSYLFRL
jgi:hypothetical protein